MPSGQQGNRLSGNTGRENESLTGGKGTPRQNVVSLRLGTLHDCQGILNEQRDRNLSCSVKHDVYIKVTSKYGEGRQIAQQQQ